MSQGWVEVRRENPEMEMEKQMQVGRQRETDEVYLSLKVKERGVGR